MKQTLIRLVLFLLAGLIMFYVVHSPLWLLWAFAITYVVEPAVTELVNRP